MEIIAAAIAEQTGIRDYIDGEGGDVNEDVVNPTRVADLTAKPSVPACRRFRCSTVPETERRNVNADQ